ncbi:hypothetical protein CLIB1423_04S04368 [[Candida] railenensis]|uniref:Uncharacterized protein n=1 Tax=[Candida] railenensis TaxID=45579 RepID=A0A9P0QMZ8_9ASCO|nr:hypothetical protein CLIB1423_04S04368 [[Candida] railenensis]
MSRLKRKEGISLGVPLPLPYKIEAQQAPGKSQPEQNLTQSKIAYSEASDEKGTIDQSLKRILVGRLRKNNRVSSSESHDHNSSQYYHGQNQNQYQYQDGGPDLEYVDRQYGGRSASGSSHANGSVNSVSNRLKTAELISKFHRLRSKIDLIESTVKSGDRVVSHSIEGQIDTLNQELDLLSQQLMSAEVDVSTLNEPSVLEELDRIRSESNKTTQSQPQLGISGLWKSHLAPILQFPGQLSNTLKVISLQRFIISLTIILFIFFTSSYYVSNLTYEYCYYYC